MPAFAIALTPEGFRCICSFSEFMHHYRGALGAGAWEFSREIRATLDALPFSASVEVEEVRQPVCDTLDGEWITTVWRLSGPIEHAAAFHDALASIATASTLRPTPERVTFYAYIGRFRD
jgi:hypothetical protein